EAAAEEEGADAVRLLTIHGAKGLEFKVVVVADAGRDKAPPAPDELLALSDGRFGFRVAAPITSARRGPFEYDAGREAAQAAARGPRSSRRSRRSGRFRERGSTASGGSPSRRSACSRAAPTATTPSGSRG